ncbi:tRNA (guanine-N(7)-)-methyltransferase isoform X11 [Cryptomeria japonica]|nr:tRNA (guanine-N(7)-)-methyltransferase isoform X11 [Cryptomeria japonica]
MVDIGCGSGRFLILLAKRFCGTKNFLGLDIRDKLVQRSQFWAKELAIKNIHFMVANATVSFGALISTYPGPLTCVSILRFLSLRQVLRVCGGFFVFVAGYLCVCCRCRAYLLHRCRAYLLHRCRPVVFKKASSIINVLVCPTCPDPHFKKKHHKRRILQKPLADAIINNLAPGGQIFMQSDVQEVAVDMRQYFDSQYDSLQPMYIHHPNLCDDEGWVLENPMHIRTEREIHAHSEGAKIYRRVYEKR